VTPKPPGMRAPPRPACAKKTRKNEIARIPSRDGIYRVPGGAMDSCVPRTVALFRPSAKASWLKVSANLFPHRAVAHRITFRFAQPVPSRQGHRLFHRRVGRRQGFWPDWGFSLSPPENYVGRWGPARRAIINGGHADYGTASEVMSATGARFASSSTKLPMIAQGAYYTAGEPVGTG
jgi:hypothetical protein